jgi:hypothetical protein
MRDFIVHDMRLDGNTPSGDFDTMEVTAATALSEFVNRALTVANLNGGINRLKILAHGFEGADGELGWGIQFCKENLKLNTVWQLYPLKGSVSYIYLMSCGAAHLDPGHDNQDGDGWTLCCKLASTTGAWVKASTETQEYSKFNLSPWHWMEIDFGDWEGNVYWFSPDGIGAMRASNDPD